MFIDARTIPNDQTIETDICIIGAGAAGITLARQFSGQPYRVTLLESGGLKPDSATQSLYKGTSTGLPYYPLDAARLRMFGGTTNHWGATCRPFSKIDFEARDWIPNSGWPIRKDDVQPYYDRARAICWVGSPDWDLASWQRRDRLPILPLEGGRAESRVAQVVPVAERSFAKHYHDEIDRAPNVTTYLNANVTEIETNDEASAVTGVRIACLSGNRFALKARVFILAAGGMENARILLLSNRRQSAGLGNQNDLVGRYFMEHPRLEAGMIIPSDRHLEVGFYENHRVANTRLRGYLGLTEETIRKEKLVDVQLKMIPVYSAAYQESHKAPEIESFKYLMQKLRHRELPDNFATHVSNVAADLLTAQGSFLPMAPLPVPKPLALRKIIGAEAEEKERLLPSLFGDIAFAVNEQIFSNTPIDYIRLSTRIDPVPNPDSRVKLGSERDPLGLPRIELHWQLSPLDKHSVRRTLEIIGAELGRASLGRLQIAIDQDDTTWTKDTRGGWHHMGTTRMSDDPQRGVVDRNCQVHGISNLFIAGSSVFPTAGSGTPTMLLVSLALRLADHIKERMR
ncbi:MAG TPA: GMC family oxidoreductase [Roseiflexaceae bacterium]|nr:GMC family oxidoreductase [Roseiflexaceae bacterium]